MGGVWEVEGRYRKQREDRMERQVRKRVEARKRGKSRERRKERMIEGGTNNEQKRARRKTATRQRVRSELAKTSSEVGKECVLKSRKEALNEQGWMLEKKRQKKEE